MGWAIQQNSSSLRSNSHFLNSLPSKNEFGNNSSEFLTTWIKPFIDGDVLLQEIRNTPFRNIAFPAIFVYIESRCVTPGVTWVAKGLKRKSTILYTSSPEETIQLGQFIGENLKRGSVIGLCGELGTGKTHLTKGLARGLGVDQRYYVTSPSFTLINEYSGRIPLTHIDLYRLEEMDQMEELGYEEYFYGDGVTVIEWAEKILPFLPEKRLMVELNHVCENRRKFRITGLGLPYRDVVRNLTRWKADRPDASSQ
jgi:tRNA threonylcarbamoyladenosine biosynthesis protein TsaE